MRFSPHAYRRLVASVLTFAAFVHGRSATTFPAPPQRLPALVITATGVEDESFDVPYCVETLTVSELQQRLLPRTVPESLREMPAVMVQKTAHGQGSPFIRGFTGFRTLLLIDGIRLNNSTFREGPNQYWNTVDPFSIRQLELVKGPASILYGSDAIGGTVNVLTTHGVRSDANAALGGHAFYRYASAENAHIGRLEASGESQNGLAFSLGHSRKEFGDLEAGGTTGLQPKTGYDEQASDVKFQYAFSPRARLVAAYQRLEQDDAWRTHRTVHGRRWHGTTIGNDNKLALDQFRDLAYLQYHHTGLGGAVDAVHLSVSFQRQEEFEHRVRNSNQVNLQGVDVNTWGLSAQLESDTSFGRWIYGVEHYSDDVESYRTNYRANGTLESVSIQGPVGDDAGYELFGAYVQDTLSWGDRGEVILGARYTQAEASARRVQDPITNAVIGIDERWDATVGSARLRWRLDDGNHWHAFAGLSQGFRAPNLSDLTRLDIARSGELEVPSVGLDPERFTSFEIGLKAQHQRFSGQAAYFYTHIDEMIDRYPADNPGTATVEVMKANVGNGHVYGVELSGQFELARGWTLWGNITSMRGEVESYISSSPAVLATRPMSRIMPLTTNLGLRWEHASRKLWSEVSAVLADNQARLSPGDEGDTQRIPPGGTPSYEVVHVRFGWRATNALSFTAALENIGDINYRIHGSGLNEPGRNLVLSGDLRF